MTLLLNLRRRWLTRPLLAHLRGVLPAMSATEREALEAVDVWWDAALFSGNPDWSELLATPPVRLSAEEQAGSTSSAPWRPSSRACARSPLSTAPMRATAGRPRTSSGATVTDDPAASARHRRDRVRRCGSARALGRLKNATASRARRARTGLAVLREASPSEAELPYLERLALDEPHSLRERLLQKLVLHALRAVRGPPVPPPGERR